MKTSWTALDVAEQSLEDFKEVLKAAREKNCLVHGDVVALHNHQWTRFVRLYDGIVSGHGGVKAIDELPLNWVSERFLAIQCNASCFAFYSICHERYISVTESGAMRAGTKKKLADSVDKSEMFDIHEKKDTQIFGQHGLIGLYSKTSGGFVRMRINGNMDGSAPALSGYEQLKVRVLMQAPTGPDNAISENEANKNDMGQHAKAEVIQVL